VTIRATAPLPADFQAALRHAGLALPGS